MSRLGRSRAFVAAGLCAIVALGAPAWADDASSMNDAGATGYVGLCDAHGQAVTQGSIFDTPFVARATGSEPARPAYQGKGQRATLLAYVPRTGVPADAWTGESLTATSVYSDARHPTAVATADDFSLAQIMADVPPQVDGLYELRLIYTAPNEPTDGGGFGSTFIRVAGSTWSVVKGGAADCKDGSAVSGETLVKQNTPSLVPAYINGRPNPAAWPHGTPSYKVPSNFDDIANGLAPEPGAQSSRPTAAPHRSATPTPVVPGSVNAAVDASSHRSSSGTSVGLIVGLVAGIGLTAGGMALWRRRDAPTPPKG